MATPPNGWQPNQTHLDDVTRTIETFLEPGQITEVRAIGVEGRAGGFTRVHSGYFNSPKAATEAVAFLPECQGVYFIPNPVMPDLLARSANRLAPAQSGNTTTDQHILRRCYFMVDLDPVRPSGISSTDQELRLAMARAIEITSALGAKGWPIPVVACSGNGSHVVYKVDLPTDDDGLIARILLALSARFSDKDVAVDIGVSNPARGLRLYGTRARKGDDLWNRPHRHSRIITAPNDYQAVPELLLANLAAEAPVQRTKMSTFFSSAQFDVDAWLIKHGIDFTGPKPWRGGWLWVLRACPWNAEHTNGAAFIAQFSNGRVVARCHHASCNGKGWDALRDVIEPGWCTRDEDIWVPDSSPAVIADAYRRAAQRDQ